MCPTVNELAIVIDPEDGFGVVPFVDGSPLFTAGTALWFEEVLCDPSPLTSDLPHRVVLRRCGCGQLDGSASAVIWVDGPLVRWTDWQVDLPPEDEDGPGPPVPPPLAFDKVDYERVVAEAMARVPPERRTPPQVPPWESIVRPGQPGGSHPSPAAPLDGASVLEVVRRAIATEVERVDDPAAGVPGGDPSDVIGWHPYAGPASPDDQARPGHPYYNPETWRYFQLVDVAYLDGLVIVEFRWPDPATPPLRYLLICHVEGTGSAEAAGYVVRTALRAQLAPGWRERLGHRWLDRDLVLLWRRDEHMQQTREDASWSRDPRLQSATDQPAPGGSGI